MIDYKETELDNGLRLVTVRKPGKLFSMNLAIKVGALQEQPSEKGICHFIEHMLFKGTQKETNASLNRKIELLGGDFNAYTDYLSTVLTVSAMTEELQPALSLLKDMVMNTNFLEEELEKERSVILSELRASLDDAEESTHRGLFEKAYDKSPLKQDVIGTEESISSFTREGLLAFYDQYYIPNNALLVLVSNLSHDQAVETLGSTFSTWEKRPLKKRTIGFEKNLPGIYTAYKEMEQSSLAFLYSFELKEEEKLPLRVLNYKLGVSGNSILYRELRENRGLAYDVYSDLELSEPIRNLILYTQVPDDRLEETEDLIISILEDIKKGAFIHEEDLLLMKKVLTTSIFSTLDHLGDLSAFLLDAVLNDEDPLAFQKDLEKLKTLTLDQVVAVSKKIFTSPTIYRLRGDQDEDHHGH